MASKCCCSQKNCLITSGVVGAVLIVVGGVLMVVFDALFVSVIKTQTSVVPGTLAYNLIWENVTVPVYRSFYLFNITNKEEFLAQTPGNFVKPVLQQIGPYTYREYLVKEDIEYSEYSKSTPQTVWFRQKATFFFDPERSNGSEDDVLVTLNFLVPLVPAFLEHLFRPGPVLNAAYATFNAIVRQTKSELLFTKTVGDYLWGFEDPLLTALLDNFLPNSSFDKFGLFLLTNVSAGWAAKEVYTGRNNYKLSNIITKFKNMSELPYWFGSTCNDINGTDGTMTQPFMNKEEPTYFYVEEMCRSLYSVYEQDEIVERLSGWRYTVPPEVFQTPENNPDNQCFCPDPTQVTCQHDGALLLSPCLFNVPLLASFPHFLYGDGYYIDKVVGLNPNKDEHEMVIIYEPTTGLVIKTKTRIQLNMLMTPHSDVKILQQIQETFAFPMVWLNESALIPESDAEWVYKLLYQADDLFFIIQIVILVLGIVLFSSATFYALYSVYKKRVGRHKLSEKKTTNTVAMRYDSQSDNVFSGSRTKSGKALRSDRGITTSSTTHLMT